MEAGHFNVRLRCPIKFRLLQLSGSSSSACMEAVTMAAEAARSTPSRRFSLSQMLRVSSRVSAPL